MIVRNLLTFYVVADRTPGGGTSEIRGFQAILAEDGAWDLEKFRAWAENRKTPFPGPRGPQFKEKKVTTLSGTVVHNFFTIYT